jgi:hypothetical protein
MRNPTELLEKHCQIQGGKVVCQFGSQEIEIGREEFLQLLSQLELGERVFVIKDSKGENYLLVFYEGKWIGAKILG